MNDIKNIILKPKKEEIISRFHPWIFSGAIDKISKDTKEGDTVKILSSNEDFLCIGHYQEGSIGIRILSFKDTTINASFYENRLQLAYNKRKELGLIREDNKIYRLIHGEGDGLPGLIIDIYGNTAIMQSHSIGMHKDRKLICEALINIKIDIKNIFYKSEATLPYKSISDCVDEYLIKQEEPNTILVENNLRFNIDWIRGQKTGFFIDQRNNRSLVEKYSSGRTVLNMFCYTGAFSVYALRGNAKEVHSVDSSARAISITNENVALNFTDNKNHCSYNEDGFNFIKNINEDYYDLIILDPPAFAKHRASLGKSLQAYKRLNLAAIRKIKKGGIIFTFSCSQVISKEQFRLAVFSASAISGRSVSIINQLTQPEDHPINIYHPEGEYIKGLVLYVE